MKNDSLFLEAALAYAEAGLAVLPLWWTDKDGNCACGGAANGCAWKPGKHPLSDLAPHGVLDAITDSDTIRAWWRRYPLANIGIAGGQVSGNLLWLDFDKRAEELFPQWQAAIGSLYDRLPVVRTGQGYRVAFRMQGMQARNDPKIARGKPTETDRQGELWIEAKGQGGYGIAPPSLHPSGVHYTLLQGDLSAIPTLTQEEADRLLAAARAFNENTGGEHPNTGRAPATPRRQFFSFSGSQDGLWQQIWARLDLYALEALLPELQPHMAGGYLGRLTCPQCGHEEAYIYPPNGTQGVAIRCNRLNRCAYSQTLFAYLVEREGSRKTAVRLLREAVGLPVSAGFGAMSGAALQPGTGFNISAEEKASWKQVLKRSLVPRLADTRAEVVKRRADLELPTIW